MPSTMGDTSNTSAFGIDKPQSLDQLVQEHIERVLAEHNGNISAAARALGMHRRTLQRKLRKQGRQARGESAAAA